jgi:hypothetical protein
LGDDLIVALARFERCKRAVTTGLALYADHLFALLGRTALAVYWRRTAFRNTAFRRRSTLPTLS